MAARAGVEPTTLRLKVIVSTKAPPRFKRAMCISCQPHVDVHKGEGGSAYVDACRQGEGGQKPDFFVDVINGWPLSLLGKHQRFSHCLRTLFCNVSCAVRNSSFLYGHVDF